MPHLYAVGQPYHADRTVWEERTVYQFRGGHQELIIFYTDPSELEVTCVQSQPVQFGLFVQLPVMLLICQFGVLPWSDSPYSWHLEQAEDQRLPEPFEPGSHALLTTMLVDAATGILRALRQCTFSPEFTRVLDRTVRAQAEEPWDRDRFDDTLKSIYQRYPSSESLLLGAAVRCQGGD